MRHLVSSTTARGRSIAPLGGIHEPLDGPNRAHLLVRAGFEPLRWSSDYVGGPYIARGDIVVVARRT